ncbi:MAG: hypothetical protein FWC41_01685 [Firmicutes bacterium]|nr:hypothetical protein [Bacillota bacterium]
MKFLRKTLCILLVLSSVNVEAGKDKQKKTDESGNKPKEVRLYGKRSRKDQDDEKKSDGPKTKKKLISDSAIENKVQTIEPSSQEISMVYPAKSNLDTSYPFLYPHSEYLKYFTYQHETVSPIHPMSAQNIIVPTTIVPTTVDTAQPPILYKKERPSEFKRNEIKQDKVKLDEPKEKNKISETEEFDKMLEEISGEKQNETKSIDEKKRVEFLKNKTSNKVFEEKSNSGKMKKSPNESLNRNWKVSLIVYLGKALLGNISPEKLEKVISAIRSRFGSVKFFDSLDQLYNRDYKFSGIHHTFIIICEIENCFSEKQKDSILEFSKCLDMNLIDKVFIFNISDSKEYKIPFNPRRNLTLKDYISICFGHFFKKNHNTRFFAANEDSIDDMLNILGIENSSVPKRYNLEESVPSCVEEIDI